MYIYIYIYVHVCVYIYIYLSIHMYIGGHGALCGSHAGARHRVGQRGLVKSARRGGYRAHFSSLAGLVSCFPASDAVRRPASVAFALRTLGS